MVNEAATYSAEVWSGLGAAGVNFIPADVEGVLRYVSQNPTRFGFTTATVLASSPACGTTVGLICAPAQLVSPNAQQTYLWGDPNHLSTAGQTIEADYIYSLLAAPSQISLLAESAVQIGLGAHAHHPAADRSVRTTPWAERRQRLGQRRGRQPELQHCDGLPQRFRHPLRRHDGRGLSDARRGHRRHGGHGRRPDARGSPPVGTSVRPAEALSLYAAYRAGPLWGNAIASYGLLQNHIARQVTLGIFTDQNNADADGHSLALALRGGYDFHLGPVTTGPVAGAVLQQVRINGFTETGSSGLTALSFGSQTRGSAVSQLGWRGSLDLGNWQPFADHGMEPRVRRQEPHGHRLAHVDRGAVLVRRRRSDRLQLGHRLGRRLLPAESPGDCRSRRLGRCSSIRGRPATAANSA